VAANNIAIKVENLSKCYQIYAAPRDRLKQFVLPRLQRLTGQMPCQYYREFWALKDVSFEVKKGETVGIIGRNGSGKSTLLQMICGTLNPTSGSVQTNGRIAALLELGSGFNPEFTGRENVYMNATVLGLHQDEIDARFDDIVAFADIGDFIEQPTKTYSSGMLVRLAFAVAINVEPEILIIDEALAVGDAAFQRKCIRKISELSDNGVTLLFVSHDIEAVRKICKEALYLSRGLVLASGMAKDVCIHYERNLFGAAKGGKISPQEAVNDQGTLDPDLLITNEQIYGDGRAHILDIAVTNEYRKKINVLYPSAKIIISYRAIFLASAVRPIFGMMITNREGICVFGTNSLGHSISQRGYLNGDEVTIEFSLTNNLGPGIYYLTCGIHSNENSEGLVYLQRRMDALIFKTVMHEGIRIGGTVNLYPKIDANEGNLQ